MALTLLRHLGRTGAAPLFVAETRSEDFAARWHAMRELIALDPAAARPHLAAMAASDRHSEVRAAATATLAPYPPPPLKRRGFQEPPCPASYTRPPVPRPTFPTSPAPPPKPPSPSPPKQP